MKRKLALLITVAAISILILALMISCAARFVFLSPSCYSDNNELSDRENYFIKKITLEAIEDRLSVFGEDGKHLFIWINKDFMHSVQKTDDGYLVRVQSHYMESFSEDCVYEIRMSEDFSVISFELDA